MTNTNRVYGTFDKDKGWSLPPREVYEKAARKGDKDMKKELSTENAKPQHTPGPWEFADCTPEDGDSHAAVISS